MAVMSRDLATLLIRLGLASTYLFICFTPPDDSHSTPSSLATISYLSLHYTMSNDTEVRFSYYSRRHFRVAQRARRSMPACLSANAPVGLPSLNRQCFLLFFNSLYRVKINTLMPLTESRVSRAIFHRSLHRPSFSPRLRSPSLPVRSKLMFGGIILTL